MIGQDYHQKYGKPRMVSSLGITYDNEAMSLMEGDVFSHCAQASNRWGFSPSVCMDEGFSNGGMEGFQHYDSILVVLRLST